MLLKKVFLKILQNSQENTCGRVPFLIKSENSSCNFPCEFCEILSIASGVCFYNPLNPFCVNVFLYFNFCCNRCSRKTLIFPDSFYCYDAKYVLISNWSVKGFAIYETLRNSVPFLPLQP